MTLKALIKAYPHIVIWLAGLGVLAAARFGYHVSTDQVIAIAGAVITAATAIVHMSMTANPHVATVAKPAVLTETMVPVSTALVAEVEQALAATPEVERSHETDPVAVPDVVEATPVAVAAVIGPGAPVKHP
jgi:hypothetical protein